MYSERRSPADAAMAPRSVGATRAYKPRNAIVEDRGVIQGLSRRGASCEHIIHLLMRGKPQPVGTATKRPRLRFPPNSNDLNVIENIWAELALAIAAMRKPPRTQAELKAACPKQWANYPAERLERHLKSLPKRLRAVVKAHGGYTKY